MAAEEEAQAWMSLGQTDWCRRKIRSQSLRGFALVGRGYWLWFGRSKGRGGEDAGVAAESQMEGVVEGVFLQYWNYHDNSLSYSDYSHWGYHVHHASVLDLRSDWHHVHSNYSCVHEDAAAAQMAPVSVEVERGATHDQVSRIGVVD